MEEDKRKLEDDDVDDADEKEKEAEGKKDTIKE